MCFSEVSSIYLIYSCRGKGRVEIAYCLRTIYSHVRALGPLSILLSLLSLLCAFSQRGHGSGPHVNLLRYQPQPMWCRSRASPANPTLPIEVPSAWNWDSPGTLKLPCPVLWNSSCSMPCCKRPWGETSLLPSPQTAGSSKAEKWHRSDLIWMNWIS